MNGTKLTSVDVYFIKGGASPVEYYKIHMDSVTVEAVQESGSSDIPTFSISLVPERVAWQHTNDAGNKFSYGWDITNNTEWLFY